MALRELLALFEIQVDDKQLKTADASIGAFTEKLKHIGATIGAAFAASEIKEFLSSQIELGSKLNDTADKLGVSTDELQKFQFAAGQAGVSAEGAGHALGFLNRAMGNALEGNQEAVQTFSKLGVEIKGADGKARPLSTVVLDVADRLDDLGSQAERTAVATKLFGRSGAELLPTLKGGSKALGEMFAEYERLGGGLSEDFIKAADDAGDELDKLKFTMTGLKSQIALVVLPIVTAGAKKFSEWTASLRKLAHETNIVKVGLMALAGGGAVTAIGAMGKLAAAFGLVSKGGGLGSMLLGLGKLGLIVGAIALLVLVFEDLYTWITGGDSAIGELLEEFLGVEDAKKLADDLADAWDQVMQAFEESKPALKEAGAALIDLFKELRPALPVIIGGFASWLKLMAALVVETSAFVSSLIALPGALKSGDFSKIRENLNRADEKVFGDNGILGKKVRTEEVIRTEIMPGAFEVHPANMGPGAGGGGKQVNQQNAINVNVYPRSGNPQDIGDATKGAVGTALDDERRQALAALASGGGG